MPSEELTCVLGALKLARRRYSKASWAYDAWKVAQEVKNLREIGRMMKLRGMERETGLAALKNTAQTLNLRGDYLRMKYNLSPYPPYYFDLALSPRL